MVLFLVSLENATFPAWYCSSCNRINLWACCSLSQKIRLLNSRTQVVLLGRRQLCRPPSWSFSELYVVMASKRGWLGLSGAGQAAERINSLTIRLFALHCSMFFQQHAIPAPEVISNSYYSTILWCHFHWEF